MREVFADTGYWTAIIRRNDALHEVVISLNQRLESCRIVTTEMVLTEFLAYFSKQGYYWRALASDLVIDLIDNPDTEVVEQTSNQFREALNRYTTRLDQRWSLTDCASFLLMEERGITEALAYDRDFEQAGFTALLRNPNAL